ncbi:uncharacterized protein SETTUDRAFT_152854 [Exserohilum turcica Et28A]|uniref:Uncharacterized protein n=1 Tax=Exserohilum turcicum (strain 28A) TaxID=671987 RepID=R0KVM4_EXST2|nr:uncharacterized protein SETTUDRAFT_152854 [Exserohilum turcica Et28A]EOA91812.1 hypothetical protein SETTUDRAFT_152854 [Exserohilum turcica Et28A]
MPGAIYCAVAISLPTCARPRYTKYLLLRLAKASPRKRNPISLLRGVRARPRHLGFLVRLLPAAVCLCLPSWP